MPENEDDEDDKNDKDIKEDEEDEEERRRRRTRQEEAFDIKSNNPHLAGGEKILIRIKINIYIIYRIIKNKYKNKIFSYIKI